jgi:hypothetical protein
MASSAGLPSVLLFDLGGVLVRTKTFANLGSIVGQTGGGWLDSAFSSHLLAQIKPGESACRAAPEAEGLP